MLRLKKTGLWLCVMVLGFALTLGSTGAVGAAKGFPVKPLNIIVPFPAGGVADVISRMAASYAEGSLGQQIAVTNMPGASGIAGTAAGLSARPDGYTLTHLAPALVVQANYGKEVPYDWRTDVEVIVGLVRTPVILIVKNGSPIDSLEKLVEEARRKPGSLKIAVTAQGGAPHLTGLQFSKVAGIDVKYIPFQGISEAITPLLGGHIDAMLGHPSLLKGYGDKIKVLGIAEEKRSDLLPELPTFKEQGYEVVMYAFEMVGVPKKTPADVVERLRDAYTKAAKNPEFIKRCQELGLVPECLSPDDAMKRFEYFDRVSKDFREEVMAQ